MHPVGELEAFDAGFEIGITAARFGVLLIQVSQKIELVALLFAREMFRDDVLDQLFRLGEFCIYVVPLISSGEETGLPILSARHGITTGAHRNETGEVLVFRPHPVGDPGADTRAGQARIAAVHQKKRRLVIGDLGMHRANHAKIIGMRPDAWKKLGDSESALAIFFKGKRRLHGHASGSLGPEFERDFLAVVFRQFGLGVEGVHLRGATVHKEMNHRLGFPRSLWSLGRERAGACRKHRGHSAERERSHAHS